MSALPRTLILYSTPACHLCDTAHALIEPYLQALAIEVMEVDISESDDLFERYGVRIPVLQHPDGRELNWPFSQAQVRSFLAS